MKTQAEKLSAKRARDARVVTTMIEMHCKGVHRTGKVPCPKCAELIAYCSERVEQCPRAEEKTFCSSCPHPCYSPAMRERIREVMRWSGPRMLFVHPILAVRHALDK